MAAREGTRRGVVTIARPGIRERRYVRARPTAACACSSQALQPDPPRIREVLGAQDGLPDGRRPRACRRTCRRAVERTRPSRRATVCTPSPGGAQYRVHTRVRVHVIPKRLFITSVTKQLSGLCIPLFVRRNDHPPRRSPRARTTLQRYVARLTAGSPARDPAPHTQCKARRGRAREGPRKHKV